MTEYPVVHLLGLIMKWAIAPIALVAWHFFKRHTMSVDEKLREIKNENSLLKIDKEDLKERVISIEHHQGVISTKLDFMSQDQRDNKSLLEKMNDKIDKLK